jgi:hypothetical protein
MGEDAKKGKPNRPPMDKKPAIPPGRVVKLTPMQVFQKSPFNQKAIDELKKSMETRRSKTSGVTREKRAWELRSTAGSNFFLRPSRFVGADAPPHADSHLPKLLAEGKDEMEDYEKDSEDEEADELSPPTTPDQRVAKRASKTEAASPAEASTAEPSPEKAAPPAPEEPEE